VSVRVATGRRPDWAPSQLGGIPTGRRHGPLRRTCRRHDVYLRQASGSGLDRSGAPEENLQR
jgi:hypothetical protein